MRKFSYASADRDGSGIDMTPMLDIVFIMLIFFIVTTSFMKEFGLPLHALAEPTDRVNETPAEALAVRIEAGNVIRIDGRVVHVGAVGANIERLLAENPGQAFVVLAADDSNAGTLVAVVDALRQAGFGSVPVARLSD